MKKAILIMSILFLIIANSVAQSIFNVIKVNGQIIILKTGTELKTGLSFSDKEKLEFKTPKAKATVINSQKGRLVLSANQYNKTGANYLPAMSNISSRGGALLNLVDISNYFSDTLCIFEREEIHIMSSKFPMNDDNFFFIRYIYKDENINKKLLFDDNKLIIDRQELFTIDGKPIKNPEITEMQLWYFRNNRSQVFISDFNPVFPDMEELKEEIKVILDEFEDKPKDIKIKTITSYISEFYGKPNQGNLKLWLEKNFGL